MFKHWMDNPIYTRLAKKDSFFVKPVFWIAGIAGVAALIISAWHLYNVIAHNAEFTLGIFLTALTAWFLMLSSPVAVALTAASIAGGDINSEACQLVKITGLSQRTFARGYLMAALRRRRLLLALTVALAPTAIVGMLGAMLSMSHNLGYLVYANPNQVPVAFVPMDVLGVAAMLSAYGIGLLALTVILGAIGVGLVLWWKKQVAVAATTALSTGMIMIGAIVILTLTGPLVGGIRYSEFPSPLKSIAITTGVCALLPMALVGLSLWLMRADRDE
ncbi:MAG: hypothetical protein JXJ17_05730 [Anaerolineae bacterium]|nr:hypothetical protein [Anaerolineae bacterium]